MKITLPSSKPCTVCRVEKPLDEFYRNKAGKHGRMSRCIECHKIAVSDPEVIARNRGYSRDWQKRNPEWVANRHRRLTYGLGQQKFDAMIAEQNNACAICKVEFTKRICVDHDHETGVVRGLLCTACNSGLGDFKDDTNNLKSAIAYLEKANSD